jgi:chloramphenicol-sensitive protein RarD
MMIGTVQAIIAYVLWGLLPIFWKALQVVSPFEILCHRMTWSLAFMFLVIAYRRDWRQFKEYLANPRIFLIFAGTATIISLNWFTYIWAVHSGYIVEASLGYFMNPLINVLLGVLVLKERLRRWQGIAIALALVGVLYFTLVYGSFPWIAIILAFSFAIYSLLKKTVKVSAIMAISLETVIMFFPACGYLIYLELHGQGAFGHYRLPIDGLLVLTGVATAVPLLWFAAAARRIPLVTLGILQYIAPSLQFLLGVCRYGETVSRTKLVGFGLIWLSLLIYSLEGIFRRRSALTPS